MDKIGKHRSHAEHCKENGSEPCSPQLSYGGMGCAAATCWIGDPKTQAPAAVQNNLYACRGFC